MYRELGLLYTLLMITQSVLAMSDQQLVTGLAILISGFSQLHEGLLYYHWQVITDLAWFSSATHMSSLICLEQYFQRHRLIWYARLFLMTGLVVMLATAMLRSGTHAVSDFMIPAVCIFELDTYAIAPSMIIAAIMLLIGFVVRVVKMFSATRRLSYSFFHKTEELWRKALVWTCRKLQVCSYLVQALLLPVIMMSLAFLVAAQCLLDFVRSHAFGVCIMYLSYINIKTGH